MIPDDDTEDVSDLQAVCVAKDENGDTPTIGFEETQKALESSKVYVKNMDNDHRELQADIYFTLATIIQGITVGFLGVTLAELIRNPTGIDVWLVLLTSLNSLILAVSFWYSFVIAYFFRFRMIKMTAVNHLVFAYFFFGLGLIQIVGFQFLDEPRIWLTINLISVIVTFVYSGFTKRYTTYTASSEATEFLRGEPITKFDIIGLVILMILLLLWYFIPILEDDFWYALFVLLMALLAFLRLNYSFVQLFQARLNAC